MRFGSTLCARRRRGFDPVLQLANVLTDRGSKYAVSGGPVTSRKEADAFLKALKRDKKFAKATHNTWAVLLSDGTPLKGDDGESGAGMVILRMLEREGLDDHIVVVTRWYGGVKLGGDRFRRVQDCVRAYVEALGG
jgi:putative IMPACT (imprinted ancient) family translation regulator